MAIDIEYDPQNQELRLQPFEDITGEHEHAYGMLDDQAVIRLTGSRDRDLDVAAKHFGRLGLLDATRLRHAQGDDQLLPLMQTAYADWILAPAAQYRQVSLRQLADHLDADEFFTTTFRFVVRFAGRGVLAGQ